MKSSREQTGAQVLALSVLAAGLGTLAGCGTEAEPAADKIEIVGEDVRLGDPGESVEEPLLVRVLGPRSVDFLGRRQRRQPVENVPVTFAVVLPKPGAEKGSAQTPADGEVPSGGSEPYQGPDLPPHPLILAATPSPAGGSAEPRGHTRVTVATDADGLARARLRLGRRPGDWKVEAEIGRKGEKVRFRAVCGVKVEIPEPESVVGAKVPIGLRLTRLADEKDLKSLKPASRRTILWQIVGAPGDAACGAELSERDRQTKTDDDGLTVTEITLGDRPGLYQVLAEVEPNPGEEPIPGVLLSVVAMDWVRVGLTLAGGVLLFVIGIRILGNGFLLATSQHMHLPTGPWARSRFQGYLGGLVAGALFESSSLVTSHLTNLANGGLLTAAAGLALVLGANVGGTMLPQILSLDPGVLAAPLLACGTLLVLVPRRLGLAPWGWVALGAGLALTGWELLKDGAEISSLSRKLRTEVLPDVDFGLGFGACSGRTFAYLGLGALAAFSLRTSNLIVVLGILLASSAVVGPGAAVPMILGANVGSASMVFLLSLRKRREARRLALANLLVQSFACL
ncbi:MAG: Na/Pi cotransporter family protein, partial [Planctomycetes bacterium]|nr:Na/Pi cotransporter family protein [Planctomycetota bacterium]